MQIFSKWSYASEFKPYEAACLMVGLDPTEKPQDLRVEHLMRLMEKAYKITLAKIGFEVWGDLEEEDLEVYCPEYALNEDFGRLTSMKLEASLYAWEQGSYEIKDWINDADASDFQNQVFSAKALATWIAETGLKSAFAFTGNTQNNNAIPANRAEAAEMSFGGHETRHLRIMAAASRRFWALYDPDDPSTAPVNEMVVQWVMNQGVSARIAEAMATMLRADGLATGRR